MQPVFTIPPTSSGDSIAGRVVLGRYRIIRPLGRGGTGVVYLGRTEGAAGFSKPVVIKRMLSSLVKDPRHAQMLVREARILANLKHTGIVGVVDLGEEDDAYVMVLQVSSPLQTPLARRGGTRDIDSRAGGAPLRPHSEKARRFTGRGDSPGYFSE